MKKVMIPPIKCQGIKSKLVPFIERTVDWSFKGRWIEPFMGSGVVGFNLIPGNAIFADSNPHLINFYNSIACGDLNGLKVRGFLEHNGEILSRSGKDYYYKVRERFNQTNDPLDFLFLNRCCFNGMIRFNRQGGFNVPFGHKPQRFSKAYITKVVNQVDYVHVISKHSNWLFVCQDFKETLKNLTEDDFLYCDPPYIGRNVDYYDSWNEENEQYLFDILNESPSRFILSTWHSNQYRKNVFLETMWSKFHVITKEHYYHIGAKEENRKPILEALVSNYKPTRLYEEPIVRAEQLSLLDKLTEYQNSERMKEECLKKK